MTTETNGGKSSEELRREVEQARSQLAGTVGELGKAIDDTKTRVVQKARQYAPVAAAVAGGLVLLKVLKRKPRY